MKVAILSDIHSNLEALKACLLHARSQGAEQYAFLGDLVGYGADPVACLDIIQEHAVRGAVVLLGNHDEAAISGLCEEMNFLARDALYWTRLQLRPDQRAFLQGLSLSVRDGNALYVHASADEPSRWHYVTGGRDAVRSMAAEETTYIFSGHVHHSLLYFRMAGQRITGQNVARSFHPTPGMPIPVGLTRQWLAIVGSVGQPRDGNNAASYVMMDYGKKSLTFHRIPYDYMTTAGKILAAGLPERLAQRLEHGK